LPPRVIATIASAWPHEASVTAAWHKARLCGTSLTSSPGSIASDGVSVSAARITASSV
jgi:hypothetical protein